MRLQRPSSLHLLTMINCLWFQVQTPIYLCLLCVHSPPSADDLCRAGMYHLFPSNSGDTEQHTPHAAVSQRRVVQLRTVHTGNQTGENTGTQKRAPPAAPSVCACLHLYLPAQMVKLPPACETQNALRSQET